MTAERVRATVLYAGAAALLAAGSVWWFAAAPDEQRADPRVEQWRQTAERLLPDWENADDSGTVSLSAGAEHPVESEVDTGRYAVTVVCVGGPGSTVRVALGEVGTDSGLGLRCDAESRPDTFNVGLAEALRMTVSVGPEGPVVFRYSLARIGG